MDEVTTKIYEYLPKDALLLREEVFLKEQGFEVERDEIDDKAYHIVFEVGGVVVSTCRVFYDNGWVIGRICVKREWRGRGLGALIIKTAEDFIKKRNGTSIRLHAQTRAVDFYKRCGYIPYGDIGYEEWCEHIWMEKTCKKV